MKTLDTHVSPAQLRELQNGKSAATIQRSSKLEELFAQQIALAGLPEPTREYRFAADRRFRFDFAWPEHKIALEIQGGYYSGGRHNRDPIADTKKANFAGLRGWTMLFAKPDEVRNGTTLNEISKALSGPTA